MAVSRESLRNREQIPVSLQIKIKKYQRRHSKTVHSKNIQIIYEENIKCHGLLETREEFWRELVVFCEFLLSSTRIPTPHLKSRGKPQQDCSKSLKCVPCSLGMFSSTWEI